MITQEKFEELSRKDRQLKEIAAFFRCTTDQVSEKVSKLQEAERALEKQKKDFEQKLKRTG